MLFKVKGVFLGAKQREVEKDGEKKTNTNIKMMDFESEIYDWYVNAKNTELLKSLADIPPMQQVEAVLEVGAYQTKPFVRLQGLKKI